MASRKNAPDTPSVIPGHPENAASIPGFEDDDLDDMPDVDRIKLQLGDMSDGETKIIIYRTEPGKKDVWLFEVEPSEFTMTALQSTYGAGVYRMRAYATEPGSRRPSLKINRTFEVGQPIVSRAAPADASGSEVARVMTALLEEVRQLRSIPPPAPVDPTASIKSTLELMTLMRTAMPPPAAPAVPDQLAMITMMREMRSFGEELAGNVPAEKESEWAPLAKAVGPLIAAMGQGRPPKTVVASDQLPLSNGSPEGGPLHGETMDRGSEDDMGLMMNIAVRRLLDAARVGTPHKEVADMVMMFASDELILGALEPETWFEQVCQVAPEAVEHRDYLTGLRSEILSRYPDVQGGAPGSHTDGSRPLSRSAAP